ncbi:MAG: hypothetical protein M3R27_10800 [Bacteroidota bacterium]|nr:hypothetical protein [Bacteroidota bacterium]
MIKRSIFAFLITLYSVSVSLAQVSVKDSSIYTPLISASYGYYFSAGDLSDRFGNNSAVQLGLEFKTQSYWTFGINGSFLFGKKVKESLFDSISTPDGGHINVNGEFADVRLYERGFTVSLTAGRMFAFKKPNPNSGIIVNVGLGFMQHKIRIETIGNNLPQLSKEYKKGYDRLSNGLLLTESIGYMYLSNNRLVNFYIGFECMQGFTENRRSYNYDTMEHDSTKRLDVLYGGKIAWILPLYKKAPQEFYTY